LLHYGLNLSLLIMSFDDIVLMLRPGRHILG
jgi:hypothetical protein